MKILHTVAGLWEGTGGPAVSIPLLCAALSARGHEVTLLMGEGPLADAVNELPSAVRVVREPLGPYRFGHYSAKYSSRCDVLARSTDVFHTHGLWLHPNAVSAQISRRHGKPFIVSPKGMLSEWALGRGRWQKRIAWKLFQGPALRRAAFLHTTSIQEEADVRRMGVTSPVGVIPNGVDLKVFNAEHINRLRGGGRRNAVVFVSRIHPTKGLELLLAAWNVVRQSHEKAELLIAGPGEANHVEMLRAAIAGQADRLISYVGPVQGEAKLGLIARARALILPSWSENYGMVVAEALACGTPVIATMAVPWPELATRCCGWRVEHDRDSLAAAIGAALRSSDSEINEMGVRGRRVVEVDHSVDATAAKMESVYLWVCGRGVRPDFVDLIPQVAETTRSE